MSETLIEPNVVAIHRRSPAFPARHHLTWSRLRPRGRLYADSGQTLSVDGNYRMGDSRERRQFQDRQGKVLADETFDKGVFLNHNAPF